MRLYRPGSMVFMFLFIVFSVVTARWLLTVSPASRMPGAKTIGAAL